MIMHTKLNYINFLILIIMIFISISVGVADFSWSKIFISEESQTILLMSRIPRTLAIILSASTMAIAGMVLQIILQNRFVSGDMVGATQSATLGLLFATLIFPNSYLIVKMSIASVAALIGMFIFILMLRRIPSHQQLLIPLIGIIYGGIIDASSTFIALQTDSLQLLGSWFIGDFSGVLAGHYELLYIAGILTLVIYFIADRLSIIGLGKNISINLGVNFVQIMWISLVVVAMISSIVVVSVGVIPFIGLVVPNIISMLSGDRLKSNLPSVALLATNLVLFSDILGRTINAPFEIPISTIFGIFGTVIFIYILFRKKSKNVQ